MRGQRGLLGLVGVVVVLGAWLDAGGVAWGNTVTPLCTTDSGGQLPCKTGWYTTPVLLSWTYSPVTGAVPSAACTAEIPFNADTHRVVECDVSWPAPPNIAFPYRIQVEISSPTASATVARPPDTGGWYNHPVAVSFGGSAFSGIASCTAPLTYTGPDTSTSVAGTCTDNAGKTASTSIGLNYDATPPTMTGAIPARPPDHNGWYNHPVSFAFGGTDATSGIGSCSRATYSGPNSAAASLAGSCTDSAGNVAVMSVPFHYDASPPVLDVSANPGDGVVSLDLRTTGDVAPIASLKVMRTPGLKGSGSSKVYGGNGGSFRDSDVRNGVKYRYTITAVDRAGNETSRTITSIPGPRLLSPRRDARVVGPPLLSWTPVTRATYYNVQLYRGRTKAMSVWPKRASLQLKRTWRFKGHRYRLTPGHYTWYVWPGFGPRSAGRYGKPVGAGTFVVMPRS
jgi:hypothetical protein